MSWDSALGQYVRNEGEPSACWGYVGEERARDEAQAMLACATETLNKEAGL